MDVIRFLTDQKQKKMRQPLMRKSPAPASSHLPKLQPPQLSGSSCAILKENFDETPPVQLPVGQTTVAFTEPQVMERMVIDAVRGAPTVAPSRTAQFHSRERAQNPGPRSVSDTSESETDSGNCSIHDLPSSGEMGNSSCYEESDSATEMDLITQSFKKTTTAPNVVPTQKTTSAGHWELRLIPWDTITRTQN